MKDRRLVVGLVLGLLVGYLTGRLTGDHWEVRQIDGCTVLVNPRTTQIRLITQTQYCQETIRR